MGAFLLQLVREWDLGPVHFVAPDVGTSAALWAAASSPALVRSLAIGGGAMAVPLQVGGSLKDIIEAPDMDAYRQIDSREILGPVYDAMAGGPPPPDVRDDYLESYAGDRFVESARYVRTYPNELPKLAENLPGIETPVQIVCGRDDPLVPMPNQEFLHDAASQQQDGTSPSWSLRVGGSPGSLRGRAQSLARSRVSRADVTLSCSSPTSANPFSPGLSRSDEFDKGEHPCP